jgi:hypothetical protein
MFSKLKAFVGVTLVCLSYGTVIAGGRNVLIDDSPVFGFDLQVRTGVKWNQSPIVDLRNDGSTPLTLGFDLNLGGNIVLKGAGSLIAGEDGTLNFNALGATTPNRIKLFGELELFSNAPYAHPGSVSDPYVFRAAYGTNDLRFYPLGNFVSSTGNFLEAPFVANVPIPDGLNRAHRYTWFGLTTEQETCLGPQLAEIIESPNRPATFSGTACSNYLTLDRYFGQIDIVDVGTRDDGDFNLFIALGYENTTPLLGTYFYCTYGRRDCEGGQAQYPSDHLSGFNLGSQGYFATSAEINNRTFLSEFRFRGGVACAVLADGSCTQNFGDVGGSGGGNVPIPPVWPLVLAGLAAFATRLNS